jgi:hypothetical protein
MGSKIKNGRNEGKNGGRKSRLLEEVEKGMCLEGLSVTKKTNESI